jgi:hypothetical protein
MSAKPEPGKSLDFRTSDLYFAAYLQVAGAPLVKHERESGGKVYFIFDGSVANIEELKTAWLNHTGKVAALPFSNAIKSLKSVCHMT